VPGALGQSAGHRAPVAGPGPGCGWRHRLRSHRAAACSWRPGRPARRCHPGRRGASRPPQRGGQEQKDSAAW